MVKKKHILLKLIHFISLLAFIYAAYTLVTRNLLPENYRMMAIGAGALIYLITGGLLYLRNNSIIGQILMAIILIVLGGASFVGANYLGRGLDTIDKMNEPETKKQVTEFSLVVLKDSDIEAIAQAKEEDVYTALEMDGKNIEKYKAEFAKAHDFELKLVNDESYIKAAENLLESNAKVMLLNESFRGVIEEAEGLNDFSEKTRVLEKVEVDITPDPEEEAKIQAELDKEEEDLEALAAEKFADFEDGENPEEKSTMRGGNVSGFSVYISGIDTYGGVYSSGRSDVNIVMSVNPKRRSIVLASIPRDTYTNISGVGYDKLTHAGIYGVQTSRRTVQNLLSIPIKYHARVNFSSLIRMVDVLGGINVHNPVSFSQGGYHFPAGNVYLNGTKALAFARNRKSFSSGDFARGQNQMRIIQGMINKAMSPSILTNYQNVLNVIMGSAQTNVPSSLVVNLINNQISNGGGWSFRSVQVSGYGTMGKRSAAMPGSRLYMMVPYQNSLNQVGGSLYRNMK